MFCDWIFDASGHGGFCYADHISVNRPICFVFYPFRVTVDIWLDGMVWFRFLIELILFNRIYSIELQVFKSQCRVQYTDAYSLRFALRFLFPPEIFNVIVSLYPFWYTDVREWLCWSERTIMCVCVRVHIWFCYFYEWAHTITD